MLRFEDVILVIRRCYAVIWDGKDASKAGRPWPGVQRRTIEYGIYPYLLELKLLYS